MSDFIIERVSFCTTLLCNLKCKFCTVQSPYYKDPYYPDFEFLKKEIDRLFEIADKINFFAIAGGEALLRDDFADMLEYLYRYKNKIGVEVCVITNGTIIPDERAIYMAKKFDGKLRFIVDNYGSSLSVNAEAAANALQEAGIRNQLRDYSEDLYCDGWVDLYGNYEKKRSLEESAEIFAKCAYRQKLKFHFDIVGGVCYPCQMYRVFLERGMKPQSEGEVVNFLDETLTVDRIREQITALYNKTRLTACMYCNGISDGSPRIKPAEQLEAVCAE